MNATEEKERSALECAEQAMRDSAADAASGTEPERSDDGSAERELSGGEERTTNNRMELSGAIAGLSALKEPCSVTLYSDSKYMIDALQKGWAVGWRARGWKKSDGKPALNPDLWARLLELTELHDVKTVWVKGHAGHAYNERCDALAVAAAEAHTKH